ncbi:GNAT family N-acetyltransferase [Wukongibacter baidiensis]|uniref:GNAT family N-acetyltransferase n=1 Tax=Wukongibacter baidiensis TaxID=1723361 RepID=UPI003D7FB121
MDIIVRKALEKDRSNYVKFAIKLSEFNRSNHREECRYDNYDMVLDAIKRRSKKIFDNRNEDCLILTALIEDRAVGYAMAKIYEEEMVADNGTGRIGLFDELYVDDSARGFGIGKMLLDEVMNWFKERDIKRVKLHAYSWNEKAKKLYENNGFSEYAVSYEKFI